MQALRAGLPRAGVAPEPILRRCDEFGGRSERQPPGTGLMAVIGILTCEILEFEFAWLLGGDAEIGRISVLEDRRSARLIRLLETEQRVSLQCLPHVHAFRPEPGQPLEVLVRVLEVGLHRTRSVLRSALAKAAQELRPRVDALLLGYGLCGNALEDPREVLDVDVPVFLPMDQDRPVDDCVALCLGGRELYCAEQHATPGTFFLPPGWSQHWQRILDPDAGELAEPSLRRVFAGYQRALMVPTPVLAEAEMLRRGQEFSRSTGLRLERREGTVAALVAAWAAAKNCIRTRAGAGGLEASP
ncbi:MAG: DUF1638 domain-containing protein [Methylococcaceae bacterium]|nr:DUF1638 domain-containing protein [Methylococcaceae bacterium]